MLLRLLPAALTALGVGCLTHAWLSGADRHQVRQAVADLSAELRWHLGCGASPHTAWLLALDAHAADSGRLWQQLRAHRNVLALAGPEALLHAVAATGNIPELRHLLRYIRVPPTEEAAAGHAVFPRDGAAADEVVTQYLITVSRPNDTHQGGYV